MSATPELHYFLNWYFTNLLEIKHMAVLKRSRLSDTLLNKRLCTPIKDLIPALLAIPL